MNSKIATLFLCLTIPAQVRAQIYDPNASMQRIAELKFQEVLRKQKQFKQDHQLVENLHSRAKHPTTKRMQRKWKSLQGTTANGDFEISYRIHPSPPKFD